ncbi:MAG: hypothetical protein HY975_04330 [Candidatus Kerfeldbacteria bacterium]|nr:hypothetical protein [Candidatus Kerfeldbacteria bacterium]
MLPMGLGVLSGVNRILFRRDDCAFQFCIVHENGSTDIVSTSTVDQTDWAPGFTGDCAFNFVLSIMKTITGDDFVSDPGTGLNFVAFKRVPRRRS